MSSKSNKNSALVKGTLIYAIGNLGTKFLNFLIVPLYTFFIDPAALGEYDLLITTVSLLSPLLTMRISEAAYRWMIKGEEGSENCVTASYYLLVRNALIASVAIIIFNFFVPIWNCYYFVGILVCDRLLECTQKILRGYQNQKLFAISGLFHTAVFIGMNFVRIVFLGEGVEAIMQSSIISIVLTLLLIFICEPRLRKAIHRGRYKELRREMLKYSAPLVPSSLAWWVMSASDRYVIRFVLGAVANGIYAVAYKFPTILQTMFTMFNNAWTDMALTQMNKGKDSEKYTAKLFEKLYILSFEACFVLIPVTKLFTANFLGVKYREASIYIGILYVATVFQGLSSFCSIGYLQGRKTKGAALTSLYGAIVNLAIDIAAIQFIGLHAAAVSTFAGFFVMWLVRMYDTRETFPIRINLKKFIPYLLIALSIAVASIWTTLYINIALSVIAAIVFCVHNADYVKLGFKKIKSRFARGAR